MTQYRNPVRLPALRLILLFAFAALAMSSIATAQLQKQAAGAYVIELAVNPRPQVTETTMLFTVTDASGKPVDTAKARGHADFSSGGLKGRATLRPDGENRMKGYGLMSAKPDLSVVVSITFADAPELKAAFKPRGPLPAKR